MVVRSWSNGGPVVSAGLRTNYNWITTRPQARSAGPLPDHRSPMNRSRLRYLVRLPALVAVAIDDQPLRLLDRIGDHQQAEGLGGNLPFRQHCVLDPAPQPAPVRAAEEDDREVLDLAGLDQGQRLEEFVECAKPAGKDDERRRVLDEHRLAHEEITKVDRQVD